MKEARRGLDERERPHQAPLIAGHRPRFTYLLAHTLSVCFSMPLSRWRARAPPAPAPMWAKCVVSRTPVLGVCAPRAHRAVRSG